MNVEILTKNNTGVALISSDSLLITDAASALDLAMSIQYTHNCNKLILFKENITEDFFILSTCLAGEIVQKYVNYQIRLAIVGDFSAYTSKPLKDFMYESNYGKDLFFTGTVDEALDKLAYI